MRSAHAVLPKNKKVPIQDNCPKPEAFPSAVQDLAELLAEIAAQRLKKHLRLTTGLERKYD